MNWLGRMLFGGPGGMVTAEVLNPVMAQQAPPTPLTQCPECESLDFTRVCTIVGVRRQASTVETHERGARYCCENCASLWSVSPSGVRRANPRSVPVTIQPPKAREMIEGEERKVAPIREELPAPRPRPRP
jgi:hypothetical protein